MDPLLRALSGVPNSKAATRRGFIYDGPAMTSDLPNLDMTEGELRFGPFRLLPSQQALYRGAERVRLGSRAFELLVALSQSPGDLLTKKQLLARLWPGLHVDETALRVHVSALRKALGVGPQSEPYIVNVVGRGYRFSSPVTVAPAPDPQASDPPPRRHGSHRLASVIGREEAIGSIAAQLPHQRLVTIVGAGGIGKTTVALVLAERLAADYPDGTHFVDLSPWGDDGLVPAAVACSLGLSNLADDPSSGVVASLRERRMLLVLDCCERVVDGTAVLVERILAEAPGVHILATSRAPRRAPGAPVLRLPPLATPAVSTGITAVQAGAFPAVQLFLERASASHADFALTDANAPLVAALCMRLDGIALAIELVAGHASAFDLPTLAAMVDDRLSLIAPGRRTALPRHRTLRAVLDWSFGTIGEGERRLLRRLAIFVGGAGLRAVQDVVTDAGFSRSEAVETLGVLVDKSLVVADLSGAARYRLLDTTRVYAAEKLRESGEANELARRHALHYQAGFVEARETWTAATSATWLAAYARDLGDVRGALDWAFSPDGDPLLGARLAAEALPVMFELSLVEECRRRAATALAALRSLAEPDPILEMRLNTTLGAALMYTPGPLPQTIQAWERVLAIATDRGVQASQARSLWGLWTAYSYTARPREALDYARRYAQVKINEDDAYTHLPGERIVGVSLHLMGNQRAARHHLEGMLANYAHRVFEFYTPGFQLDQGAMARVTLVRVLWITGHRDEALSLLAQVLLEVRRADHAISICYAAIEAAVPVLLLDGDVDAAERELDVLEHVAERNGFAIWQASARAVRLALAAARGAAIPPRDVRNALSALRATGYTAPVAWLSGVLAEAGGHGDELAARIDLVDEATAACEQSGEVWCLPELLRVRATLALLDDPSGTDVVRTLLGRARGLALEQGARAWDLRIARTKADLLGGVEASSVAGAPRPMPRCSDAARPPAMADARRSR
jgi:predicted ATPase